ncbi:aspartate/glutamate racemase family protein [Enterococcus sp. CSURQ0835]|uniref:aspartate/glutamate racemase family protein n=1 Tax=Enterococcus sp. CSURQ0835 TaxID=2681394 RepID=UPI001358D1CE|nr:aspartate/glutamate racemase family protein [Enterococcus sp. CSURQ0835]
MKKIAVMAGTPVDTQMGIELLKALPVETFFAPVSKNPNEQTFFQTLPYAKKYQRVKQQLLTLKAQGAEQVFVYCNSLSGAIDFDELAQAIALPILTPFHAYHQLAAQYHRLGVLAANAQGAAGIERELVQTNPAIQVYNVTNLDWVNAVEQKIPPQTIVTSFGLSDTPTFFQANQVEAILIGCTHFPYFLADYQKQTAIPCIDPADILLATLKTQLA